MSSLPQLFSVAAPASTFKERTMGWKTIRGLSKSNQFLPLCNSTGHYKFPFNFPWFQENNPPFPPSDTEIDSFVFISIAAGVWFLQRLIQFLVMRGEGGYYWSLLSFIHTSASALQWLAVLEFLFVHWLLHYGNEVQCIVLSCAELIYQSHSSVGWAFSQ